MVASGHGAGSTVELPRLRSKTRLARSGLQAAWILQARRRVHSASLSLSRLRPTGIPGRRSRIPRFRQPRRRRGTLEPARAVGLIDLIDQAVPKHHPGPACRVAPTLAERSRPDSSVRLAGAAAVGVDVHRKTICVPVSLSATNISSTSLTRMRIPRVRGRPPPCLGLRVIRSAYFMAVPHGSAGAP